MILATPRAGYLYLQLLLRSPQGIAWLRSTQGGPWRAVLDISAARLVRRLQRATGWTASPAIVWPTTVPSSCVVAFFHSTWDLVLAREFANRRCCFVRTHEHWARRLGTQYVAAKAAGFLPLVRKVAAGARCAASMDNFIDDVRLRFAGTSKGLSPVPARLAALTGTPLVPVWPRYERGVLRFVVGPRIDVPKGDDGQDAALAQAGRFFENAVRQDPVSWQGILPFLMSLSNDAA